MYLNLLRHHGRSSDVIRPAASPVVRRRLVIDAVLLMQQIFALTKLLLPLALFPLQTFDRQIDASKVELSVLHVEGNVLQLKVKIFQR